MYGTYYGYYSSIILFLLQLKSQNNGGWCLRNIFQTNEAFWILFHLQVKGGYAVLLFKNLLQATTVSQDIVPSLKTGMLAEILCETISIL